MRVLLIDLDPQGNATMGSGIDKRELTVSIYDWLMADAVLNTARKSTVGGYDLLPSNISLTAAEVSLMQVQEREFVISKGLVGQAQEYDYVIIDCPPSLNILTVNALVSASGVLVPMQCEYYALEGLTALVNTIEQIQDSVNPALEIEGLVRTMYDVRNNLSGAVSRQLSEHFGEKLYNTIVPRNVRVAESPSYGESVLTYDPESRGALAYRGLAGEYVRRMRA